MINLTEKRALILEMRALFENGSPAGLEAILPSFRELIARKFVLFAIPEERLLK